jgi:hypothetical protein
MSVGFSELFDLGKYHIEQSQAWFGRHKAAGPAAYKLVIMKLVLRTNKA